MKIKYFSDLHLDSSNMNFSPLCYDKQGNLVDVVILAGDIAVDDELFYRIFPHVPPSVHVLFVPGNHEFESHQFYKVEEKLRSMFAEAGDNWHFLQNESITLGHVKFMGATLWSNLKLNGDSLFQSNVEFSENILKNHRILLEQNGKKRLWNVPDMFQTFEESYAYLNKELDANFFGKKVVITHFAPHFKSAALKYKLNGFWCSNLEELVLKSDFWIHGHIHDTANYSVGNARVLSNPRGNSITYDLAQNTAFDIFAMIEI